MGAWPTRRSARCKIADETNGKWYDFVFHVKWTSSNSGFAEVWLNGRKVVQLAGIPTLYVGQDVYPKQGYYRSPQPNTAVVYHDGMRQGTSYADVAAEFPGSSGGPAPKATWGAGPCLPTTPKNIRAPLIVGVVKPGRVLKTSQGTWSPVPTRFRYQWQASSDGSAWRNLPGATRQSLLLPATFSATMVRVRVTALNTAGSGTVVSAPLAKGRVGKSPGADAGRLRRDRAEHPRRPDAARNRRLEGDPRLTREADRLRDGRQQGQPRRHHRTLRVHPRHDQARRTATTPSGSPSPSRTEPSSGGPTRSA